MWIFSFPNTIYWRDYPFFILSSWCFCQKLIEHVLWVYFWAVYSVPLIYASVFIPVSYSSNYQSFAIWFEIRKPDTDSFVPPSQNCFGKNLFGVFFDAMWMLYSGVFSFAPWSRKVDCPCEESNIYCMTFSMHFSN